MRFYILFLRFALALASPEPVDQPTLTLQIPDAYPGWVRVRATAAGGEIVNYMIPGERAKVETLYDQDGGAVWSLLVDRRIPGWVRCDLVDPVGLKLVSESGTVIALC